MLNWDLFYFASRARAERRNANASPTAGTFKIHRELSIRYVLQAMRAANAPP